MDIELYETEFPGMYITEDGYLVDDDGNLYDGNGDLIEENAVVLNESLGYNGVLKLARKGKIKIRGANRASTVSLIKQHGGDPYKEMLNNDKLGVFNKKLVNKADYAKAMLQNMKYYKGKTLADKMHTVDKLKRDGIPHLSDIGKRRISSWRIGERLKGNIAPSAQSSPVAHSSELNAARAKNIVARLGKKK